MAQDIIRGDVNYGELVITKLDGISFLTGAHRAEILALHPYEDEPVPEFNTTLVLEGQFPNGISTSRHYVLKNSDVRKLAAALSKHTQMEVRVCACARILARYVDGQLVGEIRSLTDFYTNLDAEEIAASSF